MRVISVALTSGYSAILSLLGIDTVGPVGFSLSVGQTSADIFELYGTLDAAATTNNNAQLLGQFNGGSVNLPKALADQARTWPYLLILRVGGSTAGTFYVAGNPAASPAVVSATAPVVIGNYTTVLDLTTLGADEVRIGGSRQMTASDVFDVFMSDDSTMASSTGTYYAGRITGGGGVGLISVKVSGLNYAIIQRAATSTALTAGTIIAAGVSPSSGGGSSINLTTLAVGNTAVNGAIGALTAAQSVDVYSSFLLTQTTAGVTATLPNPTITTAGKLAIVTNNDTSTQSIVMYGETNNVGATQLFMWDGTAWVGGQNLTQGGNAFGAQLQFGTVDNQNVVLFRNNVAVLQAQAASLTLGDITAAFSSTLRAGTGGLTLSTVTTGPINIDTGTTGPVNIGAGGAGAKAITLGAILGATSVSILSGSTGITQTASGPISITSGTNQNLALASQGSGNITAQPGATGQFIITPRGAGAGDTTRVAFRELAANGTNAVSLQAPDALGGEVNLTLPSADGVAGAVGGGSALVSNGAGALSFIQIQSGTSSIGAAGVSAAIAANITASSRILFDVKDFVASTSVGLEAKAAQRVVGAPGSFIVTAFDAAGAAVAGANGTTFDWFIFG